MPLCSTSRPCGVMGCSCQVISETTETDRIVALCPMRQHTFAYALVNGTVGIYDRSAVVRARLLICTVFSPELHVRRRHLTLSHRSLHDRPNVRRWRVKAKHDVTSITGFDLDGDGEPELISGEGRGSAFGNYAWQIFLAYHSSLLHPPSLPLHHPRLCAPVLTFSYISILLPSPSSPTHPALPASPKTCSLTSPRLV